MFTLGYADNGSVSTPRKAIDEIVCYEKYE